MIEKLDNNEQILLMYLAGELPAGDQADVERLLAADAGLRQSLTELQASQAFVDEELAKLNEASPLPVSVEAAARQAARAMRQRLAQPRIAATEHAAENRPRSWWWLYPTVAAASVLIVAMLWLNRQTGPTSLPPNLPNMNSGGGDQLADRTPTGTPTPAPGPEVSPAPAPAPPPAPTAVAQYQNSRDADDALLLDSLKSPVGLDEQRPSPDDDSKRVALNDLTAVPQDEISQLLLNANGVQ